MRWVLICLTLAVLVAAGVWFVSQDDKPAATSETGETVPQTGRQESVVPAVAPDGEARLSQQLEQHHDFRQQDPGKVTRNTTTSMDQASSNQQRELQARLGAGEPTDEELQRHLEKVMADAETTPGGRN